MGRKDKPGADATSVGSLLRRARQARGLSLTAMALELAYSTSYLSGIETGKERATLAIQRKYEQLLGVEIVRETKRGNER